MRQQPNSGVGTVGADRQLSARWEHFEHQSDIGVRGIGPDKEAAFEQAAMALTAVVTSPDGVASSSRIELACEATDDEALLVAWLNALVYEMSVRRMLFSHFRVRIDSGRLRAIAWGEPISVQRHQPTVEVKGATYTALRVARSEGGGWLAQTVVDV
ncbi:MAG: archease [Burkholderiaceae bacterium]|nr:archease [Burkholderiaceae bacterium]